MMMMRWDVDEAVFLQSYVPASLSEILQPSLFGHSQSQQQHDDGDEHADYNVNADAEVCTKHMKKLRLSDDQDHDVAAAQSSSSSPKCEYPHHRFDNLTSMMIVTL